MHIFKRLYKDLLIILLSLKIVGYKKLYTSANKNTLLARRELEELQNDKFIKLISYARDNVPYYKTLLKNIRIDSLNDIDKIPFLSKKEIKINRTDLMSSTKSHKDLIPNSTSGSTGEAMYFYSDKKNQYGLVCTIRGDELSGWVLGDKMLTIWGAEMDLKGTFSFHNLMRRFVLRNKMLSSYYLNDKQIAKYVRIINKYKPKILVGYPSALRLIADTIIKLGLKLNHKFDAIISAGENLYSVDREIIQKVFSTEVFNRYGCRDVYHIASECKAHNGLHISSDHVILEVIDEKGNSLSNGEVGEIVLTDLDNYAFPLIRYKIGDLGIMSSIPECSCACNLPLLQSVEGRTFDIIVGPNGNKLSGTFWTLLFRYEIYGIEKFQIVQNEISCIHIYLVINTKFNEKERTKILQNVKEKFGEEMKLVIEIVPEIATTQSGKYRWIISKVSPFVINNA